MGSLLYPLRRALLPPLLLIAATAHAATPADAAAATDRFVAAEMRAQRIPGVALAVLRHGEPLYVRGYGVATLEHLVAVASDTRFQIGSVGKQFTATLVLQLAREGTLSLDVPLATYLPEIPASWAGVTLRRMLNHQAGIPQLTTPEHNLLDLHHEYTDAEYVRLATSLPLDFEPGTDAAYSDTAYVLLGIVVNRVTGRFYGDLLAERVFRPLGMERTQVLSDADIIPGRASGYEKDGDGRLRNQSWVSAALNRTADGSLYSTVLDLARWDAALYGDRVLPQAELERMWSVDPHYGGQPPLLHFGYGWEINTLRGHRVIEYDGNWQGFQAAMARYPDRGLTVIVLTNLSLCRAQQLAHTVAGLFEPEFAHYEVAPRDPASRLTSQFHALLERVQRDQIIDRSRLAPGARTTLTPGWAASLARDLRSTGSLEGTAFAEERPLSRGRERVYAARTREMTYFFTVRYAADGRVAAIDAYHEY